MPKRQVQADQLANDFGEPQETPEQKRQRIAQAIQSTQSIVGDIQSGSRITRQVAKDDMVMRKAYRRAVSEGMSLNDLAMGLDMGPQLSMADVMLPDMPNSGGTQFLTEEFPTNHDDLIMNELYQPPVQERAQPRKFLTENQPARRQAPQSTTTWKTRRYLGETRSGNEVRVWKVENTKTGTSLQTLFRIEAVASRVAMLLAESGDINDPRVVSVVNAYEKRDRLLKEARQLEKTADGKQMKTERLRQIRAEINQLEYRLGV